MKQKIFYRVPWIGIGAITLLVVLAYSNTFHASFHLDDSIRIVHNAYIRDPMNIIRAFGTGYSAVFFPYLSFAVNYKLNAFQPFGYHVVNITIHVLCSLAVYGVILLAFAIPKIKGLCLTNRSLPADSRSQQIIALFGALIFACHPVQTQAVTYIVQRIALMAALFYFATVFCYILYRLRNQRLWFAVAWLCACAAMFSKPNAYTIPFSLAAVEIFLFGTKRSDIRQVILKIAPFAATWVFVYAFAYHSTVINKGLSVATSNTQDIQISRLEYFLTQWNVIVTYLRLLFIPIAQNFEYDYPISRSLLDIKTLACGLLLLSLWMSSWYFHAKGRPFIAFGIIWFFIALSVESSIIPIRDVIFEHRLYLPMLGFCFFSAELSWTLFSTHPKMLKTLMVLIIVLLSILTFNRNSIWKSEISLWEDVVSKSPNKPRAVNLLAQAYQKDGRYDSAILKYEHLLELVPDTADAYVNAGAAYEEMGNQEKAIELFEKAIEMNPNLAEPYDNLGKIYGRKGNFAKAKLYFEWGLQRHPRFVRSLNNLAAIYQYEGEFKKAEEYLKRALEIDPGYPVAYKSLAQLYAQTGKKNLSEKYLERYRRLKPDDRRS